MSRFRRRGDRIRWELDPYEVQLLENLRNGLVLTLEDPDTDDPVVARLFPPAVADDDEADTELRRLIRDDLLSSKRRGLDALLEILERAEPHRDRLRVDLTDDEPHLVLGVLNDVRLALGARLGVERLDREAIPEGSPEEATLAVMDHLAWFQERLLAILDPSAVVSTDPGELDPNGPA